LHSRPLNVILAVWRAIPSLCRREMDSFLHFNDTATAGHYTLSLHDALPIYIQHPEAPDRGKAEGGSFTDSDCGRYGCLRRTRHRSEEHTSELQSRENLVCRLLLEKKHQQSQNNILRQLKAGNEQRKSRRRCA